MPQEKTKYSNRPGLLGLPSQGVLPVCRAEQLYFGNGNIHYNFLNGGIYTRFSILCNNNVYSTYYNIASGLGIPCTHTTRKALGTLDIRQKSRRQVLSVAVNRTGRVARCDLCETMRPEADAVPTQVRAPHFSSLFEVSMLSFSFCFCIRVRVDVISASFC